MCFFQLQFYVKEIPCDSSDCIIGIKLFLSNTTQLFIFGVYLPYGNAIPKFKQSIDIMQSLYYHYAKYGKVLFARDFNSSLLHEYHTNVVKLKLLCGFVELSNLCVPMIDFSFLWRAIQFYYKTNYDWLLITWKKKNMLDCLKCYASFERRFNTYYLLSSPYLCNVVSCYACAFFTYSTKQALGMAQGDTRGARNIRQLYWNWTIYKILDTQIESSQDSIEYKTKLVEILISCAAHTIP